MKRETKKEAKPPFLIIVKVFNLQFLDVVHRN